MANATDGVRGLVADVLRALPQTYTDDVTDEVCLAIETDPILRRRYDELAAELKDWVVNNWIGRYTPELTGRRSAEQVPSRSHLIRWYRKLRTDGECQVVSTVDFEPLSIGVPLREDPPGVFRVGESRVLLELVLDAFRRGESAEAIVRAYRTLRLADVYAVISRYLADPAPFDEYLRRCDEDAAAVRREMDAAGMTRGVGKEGLLEPRTGEGPDRVIEFLVDQNFNEDIVDGLTRRDANLQLIRVRDVGLAAARDPTILECAASHGLVLLTHDRRTIPPFAHARLAVGLTMPGVFHADNEMPVDQAIDELLIAVHCLTEDGCRNLVRYFPM